MYCGKPPCVDLKHCGHNVPLHAAAGKHISSEHVDTITKSLRTMAAKLGDTKLQNLLGSDVRSSELYYHNPCHTNYKRKYDNIIAAEECAGAQDGSVLVEFIAITAVKDYDDDRNEDSFPLKDLEAIYLEKLAELGKEVQSHMTRFATKLETADVGCAFIQTEKSSNCGDNGAAQDHNS